MKESMHALKKFVSRTPNKNSNLNFVNLEKTSEN